MGSMGLHWIIVIIIASVAVLMFLWVSRPIKKETPKDVLKRRYANGEITKEELEEELKHLR